MALCPAGRMDFPGLVCTQGSARLPITHNLNPSSTPADHLVPPLNWVLQELPKLCWDPIFHLCCFLHVWFTAASSHPVHTKCSFPAAVPFSGFYTMPAQQSARWKQCKKGVAVAFYPKSECRSQLHLVYTESVFLR